MCFARYVEGFRGIKITGVYMLTRAVLDNSMHLLPCKGKIPLEKGFFGGIPKKMGLGSFGG